MKIRIVFVMISILFFFVLIFQGVTRQTEKDSKKISIKKTEQYADVKTSIDKTDVKIVERDISEKSDIDDSHQIYVIASLFQSLRTDEQINWHVISSGGNKGNSPNFIQSGTVGQTAVDLGISSSHYLNSGFWQNSTFMPGCCVGIRGNVDDDGSIDIADLVYLVAYSFGGGPAPVCTEEADVDASSGLDIADIVYLVSYMFGGGPAPLGC